MPSTRASSAGRPAPAARRGGSVSSRRGARASSRASPGASSRTSRSSTRAVGRSASRSTRGATTASAGRPPRSRSAAPAEEPGAPDEANNWRDEFNKLRDTFAQREAEHTGVVAQLQAQIEDLQMSRGEGTAPGEVEVTGVRENQSATAAGTPPAPSVSAETRRALTKLAMTDWSNMHLRMGWLVLGQRPAVGTLTKQHWQALFPDVRVSTKAASTLNSWANINVGDWRMASDDTAAPVPLDESMEIFVDTLARTLGQGSLSVEAGARLQLLNAAFRDGLRLVRAHCRENRAAMRHDALVARFVDFINQDLQTFSTEWMQAAIAIKGLYAIPPDTIESFPAVIVPRFEKTRGYINMGGLSNLSFFRPSAASVITSPTKKMRVTGGAQEGQNSRYSGRYRRADSRYCFDFNATGCDRESCKYLHEKDPAQAQQGTGS